MSEQTDTSVKQNSNEKNEQKGQKWGYDLYPERKGKAYSPTATEILKGSGGEEHLDRIKCERNVYACVKKSPLVRLMMSALKSSGCPVDIRRHISCEVCDYSVSGGYDPLTNQIVICQNVIRKEGIVQGILTHEMIHMFDYCKNKIDFQNIEHLACTEIRAANLTHCSFMSAMAQGDASPFRIKQMHQNCVKTKAMWSVLAVRKVTREEAINVVDKVFDKCYADLEPIGRRIKRGTADMFRAYRESPYYGYDHWY